MISNVSLLENEIWKTQFVYVFVFNKFVKRPFYFISKLVLPVRNAYYEKFVRRKKLNIYAYANLRIVWIWQ